MAENFEQPQRLEYDDDPSLGKALENPSERQERELRTLKAEAMSDLLTGILNRRGFEARVRDEYENLGERERKNDSEERGIDIVFLDIDKFKNINDTFGHDAGDEVLRRVSRYLRERVRAGDIVGRWGGEEFMLALKNGPDTPVAQITEELRQGIENLDVIWKGQHIRVTASFGIAEGSGIGLFDNAIHAADAAVYAAKKGGRNRVVLFSQLPEEKRIAA